MNYSEFRLEQLTNVGDYETICDMFFSLAKDNETKEKLESILYLGGYKDYNPNGGIGRDDPYISIQRRVGLAYLLIRNPESFEELVNNKIMYFHGTNANALPGICKYGMNSFDKLQEEGVEVSTGEVWSRYGGRDFISFTDVLDIAEMYSGFSSKKDNDLSFPIVFGTTKEDILTSRRVNVHSDIPEVGIKGHFPKESIRCVMVPSDKINIVKKIVGPEMKVLAMDDVDNRFYGILNDGFFELCFDNERYEKLKNNINNKSSDELKGIKESVFSRVLNKIQNKMNDFMGIIERNESDESKYIR